MFGVILLDDADLPHQQTLLLGVVATVGISVFAHGLTARPLTNRYIGWYQSHPRDAAPPMETVPAAEHRWRTPRIGPTPTTTRHYDWPSRKESIRSLKVDKHRDVLTTAFNSRRQVTHLGNEPIALRLVLDHHAMAGWEFGSGSIWDQGRLVQRRASWSTPDARPGRRLPAD